MKKLILLFFVFTFINIFSQEYHFDYKCYNAETQIRGSYRGHKRTNIIYFNSENKDFIAYNYSFSEEPKRSFYLYDYKNNFMSFYTINKESDFSSLNYLETNSIRANNDERKIQRVDVGEFAENVFIIKAFPNEKGEQPNLELKIVVEKSEFPMSRIKFMDVSMNIHDKIYNALLTKLNSENYRIVDVITNHKNGVIMHSDLSKCEKINLKFLTEKKAN